MGSAYNLPVRFGYTGRHNRRGGTGDLASRPYTGGASWTAQKMVRLSPKTAGVRVSHTTRYGRTQNRNCVEKHTERDTSRVTYLNFIRGTDVSRLVRG